MYNQIMQRPMFQTPQQRQGMGIMAGVAPVRGYEEGGMAAPEYTPKFMREEDSEEDGMGRMLFEFLVVDPNDPIDVGMASASAAMMAAGITAPGAIAAQLARMGYKGKKLFDAVKKIESLGKPSKPDAGMVRQAMAPVGATYGASQTGRMVGEVPEIVEAVGGIAELSGGGFLEGIAKLIPSKKVKAAIEILDKGIDAGRVTLDDIFDAVRRGDIQPKDADALIVKAQQAKPKVDDVYPGDVPVGTPKMRSEDLEVPLTTPKMKADDLATPPESAMPTPPKPPAKVADEVTEAAEEATKKTDKKPITQRVRQSVPGQVVSGALKPITSPIRVGAPLVVGGIAIDKLIQSGALDEYIKDPRVQQLIQAGKPVYEAITEFFGPVADALFPDTGERVELTESAQARLPEVETARKEGFPEPPAAAPATGQEKVETGTPKPEATGIMKFLFGKDGIGGEPGAAGRLLEKTQDPRLQYALAVAGAPSEGRTPRNFMSDLVLAGQEYDEKQAKIKSLEGDDTTALMQNYEFLKERGKKDDEIFDLLVGKSSQADTLSLFVDLEQEIYDGLLKRPEYLGSEVGADGLTGLQRAARDARIIARQRLGGVIGSQASAPQDSEAVETVDLE